MKTPKSSKRPLIFFTIISTLTIPALIYAITIKDPVKIGLALAALILYTAPIVATLKFKIKLGTALQIAYYLFIFASLILGEVFAFYGPFPFWDVILHLLSGFMLTGIGLSIIQTASKNKAPILFTLFFAFCFSITLGVTWECLEFGFDIIARTDAQKDAHVKNISTITLQRDGGNRPVRLNHIKNTDIHLSDGQTINIEEGYLDIGLIDTMKDLLTNAAGSSLFLVFGYFYLKNNSRIVKHLIPTKA